MPIYMNYVLQVYKKAASSLTLDKGKLPYHPPTSPKGSLGGDVVPGPVLAQH